MKKVIIFVAVAVLAAAAVLGFTYKKWGLFNGSSEQVALEEVSATEEVSETEIVLSE